MPYFISYSNISEYGRHLYKWRIWMSNKSKCTIFEIRRPENVHIKPKRIFLCETVHEIWKSKFFIFYGSHFEYCKKWWKHQHLRLLPSKFWNSMVSSSSVPNVMLLSSSENVWPFLTLRALAIYRYIIITWETNFIIFFSSHMWCCSSERWTFIRKEIWSPTCDVVVARDEPVQGRRVDPLHVLL